MRLFVHQAEAGLLVDAPGGMQHVVCPQRELAVADLAGEAHALLHEAFADAEAARPGLDEEQTQPGDRLRFLDAKHRPHVLTVQLRDPAALPLRVVVTDELGDDVRDQRLELLAPAVFPGVQHAVALNHPAHRSEEHTSELQSQSNLVCRLLLEKKKKKTLQGTNYNTSVITDQV